MGCGASSPAALPHTSHTPTKAASARGSGSIDADAPRLRAPPLPPQPGSEEAHAGNAGSEEAHAGNAAAVRAVELSPAAQQGQVQVGAAQPAGASYHSLAQEGQVGAARGPAAKAGEVSYAEQGEQRGAAMTQEGQVGAVRGPAAKAGEVSYAEQGEQGGAAMAQEGQVGATNGPAAKAGGAAWGRDMSLMAQEGQVGAAAKGPAAKAGGAAGRQDASLGALEGQVGAVRGPAAKTGEASLVEKAALGGTLSLSAAQEGQTGAAKAGEASSEAASEAQEGQSGAAAKGPAVKAGGVAGGRDVSPAAQEGQVGAAKEGEASSKGQVGATDGPAAKAGSAAGRGDVSLEAQEGQSGAAEEPAAKAGEASSEAASEAQEGQSGAAAEEPAAKAAEVGGDQPTVARMGVSLRGLRRLRAHLTQLCASDESPFKEHCVLLGRQCPAVQSFDQLTITQLVHLWVKQVEVTGVGRLAEAARLIDQADIGPPTYFISHAWQSTARKLFDTIEAFLASAADSTCVWLDFVAINQHEEFAQSKEDVAAFEACLKQCTGGTLVVVDQQRCNPATRGWCLYEWDHTLLHHGPDGLHMRGMQREDLDDIVRSIDVEKTECVWPADLEMIQSNILKHHHSYEAFDTRLKLHLMLDPLSYKVDLEQLTRRSGGTRWRWGPVLDFLAQPAEEARALCILAGAGTGKSSISAALTQQLLGRQDPKDGSWLGPVSAVHFVKHSDQRRLDPVRMIKSLAYQLAVRVQPAAEALLKLSPKAVAELRQPDAAFDQLLLPVLAAIKEPVVLLIDALDEADPPEEQRPDFDSNSATVKACGNAVLSLLVSQLAARLGPKPRRFGDWRGTNSNAASGGSPGVKFILTTRPEACCGGIQGVLDRAFQGGTTCLRPSDVRGEAVPGQGAAVPGAAVASAAVASTAVASAAVASTTVASTAVASAATTGTAASGTTAAVAGLGAAVPGTAASGASVPVPGSTDQVLVYNAVVRECHLSDLPTALEGGATLQHLHAAYRAVFERCPPCGQVSLLLQLLLAAQEPLSTSLLQQMGIDGCVLRQLPGWGCLFFEAEHHIYLLHKSLNDWLLLSSPANPFDQERNTESDMPKNPLAQERNPLAQERNPLAQERNPLAQEGNPLAQERNPRDQRRKEESQVGPKEEESDTPWGVDQASPHRGAFQGVGHPFAPDIGQGHTCLGRQLAKDALLASDAVQPSDYCLKYTVLHLRKAGPDCAALLDDVLSRWDFLRAAIRAGHGGKLLSALGAASGGALSEYAMDAYRWLARFLSQFELKPLSSIEQITVEDVRCPVGCFKFQEAARRLGWVWVPTRHLGGYGNTYDEWPPDISTFMGHTKKVNAVAFSPDGKQLATCSDDCTTKVWDLISGTCTATLQASQRFVDCVAFSPNGRQLATGSEDRTAKVWDLASGTCTMTLEGHKWRVSRLAFSPDGKFLATCGGGSEDTTAKVWDLASGTCTATLPGDSYQHYTSVAFSPDGKYLAVGSGERSAFAKVWDLESVDVHVCATLSIPEGHLGHDRCLAFSPGGKQLATSSFDASAAAYTCHLWDVSSGKRTASLTYQDKALASAAFSPDGRRLVVGCRDCTAKVWDLASGTCTATLHGHGKDVSCISFSPDGRQLATGSWDATVKVWGVDGSTQIAALQGHSMQNRNFYDGVSCAAFSTDGKQLATGSVDLTAKVWDLASGACIATLKGHSKQITSVALSPDGKQLATGGWDCTAKVWDLASGACTATLQGHAMQVSSVAFSPDGNQLTTASVEPGARTVKVWDLASGACTATSQEGLLDAESMKGIFCMALSQDRKQVAMSYRDRSVKVWDLEGHTSHTCTSDLQCHATGTLAVAFSPDGKQLATGGRDCTAKVWDLASGVCTATLLGHNERVMCVTFSPDGRRLATGSTDRTVKVWDLQELQEQN